MIVKALTQNTYKWLLFVWAFDKNYIGSRHRNGLFISYDQLFDLILKQHQDKEVAMEKIRIVAEWKILCVDNILIALVQHHLDDIAIAYMGFYAHLMDKELFIFCMTNGNHFFLQEALRLAAFDKMIFREETVINQILNILKEGYRTNFLMNILSLIDISVWKNKHLKDLIEIINDYVEENYDKNRLLLSPNPIMSIALAAELLGTISQARRKFENECVKIKKSLMDLGKMYSSKIEDEQFYESQIMNVDFKNRTVLKIITLNGFESLMDQDDPKAENLMLMIWHGKEATQCDGNIYGYSNLSHIIMTRAKKISGKKTSLMQMITNYYEPNFKVDYSFQYRYRSRAVSFYFYKEFFCALAMLIIFQYINYKYLILFSDSYLNGDDDDGNATSDTDSGDNAKINRVIKSIRDYIDWNLYAMFFSVALIFQLLLKILFNICAKGKKVAMDKWTIMDSISAILNILAVQLIQKISPDSYLKSQVKDIVDYFMIIVLCICWLRFFVYFLVVRSISKLILTLISMVADTISFMFIVSCFILIMASVFTTLYQDTNPEKYGDLAISVRYLFDALIGQYDYDGMGDRALSHSILLMCHVFFSNILLLNYLIAILSTTYENMKETGIFKYKSNLYQYCERFMTAFDERSYGEIILHPPPLSYLSAMMMPFLVSSFLMRYISKGFSYFMFWLENTLFISGFLMFEVAIAPIAYIKIWINIVKQSMGVLKTIANCIVMGLIGIIMVVFLLFRDVAYLINILSHHEGCRYGKKDELKEDEVSAHLRVKVYNETRSTVISLYKRLQKHMRQSGDDDESDTDDEDHLDDPDFFHIEDDENMNEDFLYVVKKSLIIDEWKKRRLLLERREKIRAKREAEGTDMKSKLANSFKKKLLKKNSSLNGDKSTWSVNRSINFMQKSQEQRKPKDLTNQLKVVFLETLKKEKQRQQDEDEEDIDMSDFTIPEGDVQLVDKFLTQFTIVSESSMSEHLDIMLMLKALPNKIMDYNLEATEMFNFSIFQISLIAYQNTELVNAFEYIDDKNRERIQNVKDKLVNQKNNLNDVKDILELVKIKIERNEEYFSKQKGISVGNLAQDNSNFSDATKAHGAHGEKQNRVVDNIHKRELNV